MSCPNAHSYLAVLAVVALAAVPATVHAQSPADGVAAWSEADFGRAQTIFEAVLASPSSDRAAVLSAHRHLAAIALLRHDDAGAHAHARVAVALQHDVTAPDGAPAAAAALFEAARSAAPTPPTVTVDAPPAHAGTPLAVHASLTGAPDGLVARLHLLCRGESSLRAEESGPPPTLTLTLSRPEETPRCEAEALGATGVALFSSSLALALGATAGVPARAPAAHGDDTLLWALVIGGGVLVVAATIVIVVLVAGAGGGPSIGDVVVRGW